MEISLSINEKMSFSSSLSINSDGLNVGDIVWARRDHDGIYWPGKINSISNNLSDTISINNNIHQYQTYSYLIQFFGCNQTHWTIHVLPYQQYRDYMSKNLLIHYESYPQIKYQFLNAINQADYTIVNENSNSNELKNNYNYLPPTSNSIVTDLTCHNLTPLTTNEYLHNHYGQSSNNYPHYVSNSSYNNELSVNNYCTCCIQPSFSSTNQLSIETNRNSLIELNNEYPSVQTDTLSSQAEIFQKKNSVIIITTKTYSNSSFISYLFNCFSHFIHHSIIYIDDSINNYQHPTTLNISYLICLDYFDFNIKQILNSTILNNFTAHINYFFLILNPPSYEVIKYFYSTVIDQRTIVILHYNSTFDNEPLLLCSGNRTTYELIRSTLLKYLCTKIKYVESRGDEDEQFYSMNDNNTSIEYQSNNIKSEPMIDSSPNQILKSNSFIKYSNIRNNCLVVSSIMKHSKKLGRQKKLIKNLGRKILKQKSKQHMGKKSVSSSEYHIKNILDTLNTSK